MQISPETVEKIISRVWHVALLAGSAYVMAHPEYVWAIPLLQSLGQVSTSPK